MPSRHHLSFPSVCAPIPYVTSLTRWVRLTRAYPREVHTSGRAFARRGLTVVKSGARAGYAECNTVPETSWRNWTRTYWCGASAASARGRWSEDPRPYEDDAWCRGSATGRGAIRSFRRAWITACRRAGLARVVERDGRTIVYPLRIPHDFRRTAVRNLERAGVPRSTAIAMVGHRTESIYRRYATVDETMLWEGPSGSPRSTAGNRRRRPWS